MIALEFKALTQAKRKRCPCCDLMASIREKVMFLEEGTLAGDLELCAGCTAILRQALAKETVVAEWDFSKEG